LKLRFLLYDVHITQNYKMHFTAKYLQLSEKIPQISSLFSLY